MDEPLESSVPKPNADLNTLMREMSSLATGVREIIADLSRPWKGDLLGPAGWARLQEATYSAAFADRLSPEAIKKLRQSYAAWTFLYAKLRFITSTRPVSNS